MHIIGRGFDNKSHLYDADTKTKWGNHCPVCREYLRWPSHRWSWGLYRHVNTTKHQKAEEYHNLMSLFTRPEKTVIGEAQARHTCNRRL